MVTDTSLMLSAQRALLFAVSSSLRFLSMEVNGAMLRMRLYLDTEPAEDEKDMYFAVSGEISGDFPELDDALSSTEFVVSSQSFDDLEHLKLLVFARAE